MSRPKTSVVGSVTQQQSASGGGGGMQAGRLDVSRTRQQRPVLHEIFEDQLVRLLGMRRDGYSDLFAGGIAAAFSLLPTSLESLIGYFETPSVHMSWLHLAEIILCGSSVAVSVVTFFILRKRKDEGEELASTIRGQAP